MTRLVAAVVVGALALGAAACGSDAPAAIARKVDVMLAPVAVLDGAVTLHENSDDATRRAFADAGSESLVADGRLWELRRADRLVGTLQVSSLDPDVDLSDADQRETIANEVLVAAGTRILVGEIEVATISVGNQAVFVWFGDDLVEILTIDGYDEIEPEDVLREIIGHQLGVPAWIPVQPAVDDSPLDLPE